LHFNFGQLLLMMGRYEEAEEYLRKALATHPTSSCHDLLSQALQLQGKTKDAKEHRRKAEALDRGEGEPMSFSTPHTCVPHAACISLRYEFPFGAQQSDCLRLDGCPGLSFLPVFSNRSAKQAAQSWI